MSESASLSSRLPGAVVMTRNASPGCQMGAVCSPRLLDFPYSLQCLLYLPEAGGNVLRLKPGMHEQLKSCAQKANAIARENGASEMRVVVRDEAERICATLAKGVF